MFKQGRAPSGGLWLGISPSFGFSLAAVVGNLPECRLPGAGGHACEVGCADCKRPPHQRAGFLLEVGPAGDGTLCPQKGLSLGRCGRLQELRELQN